MPETNTTSLSNAYKKRNAIRVVCITGIIAVIAVIIIVQINNEKNSVYNDYVILAEAELPYANADIVYNFDGNILLVGKDGAVLSDASGNQIWNRTYQIKSPLAAVAKNYAVIAGFNENQLYLCDSKAPSAMIDTVLPITAVCVSESGISGVILRDTDFDRINLYTKEGVKFMEMQCSPGDYGIPYAISLSPNGALFMAAFADVENGRVLTRLNFYSFDNVGQNYADHLVSSYTLDDALSPYLSFLNAQCQTAVSNISLTFYEGDKIPKQTLTQLINGQILSVMTQSAKLGIIRTDSAGMQYVWEVFNLKAQKECEIALPKAYTNMAFSDKTMVAYDNSSFMVAGYNGSVKYNGEFDGLIRLMIGQAANKYLIVAGNKAVTVRLL